MRKLIKILLLIIVLMASIAGLFFLRSITTSTWIAEEEEMIVEIEKGGVLDVARELQAKGVIENEFIFSSYVFLRGGRGELRAGRYKFEKGETMIDVFEKLRDGDVFFETITLKEGWTLREMAHRFEERGIFEKEDFFRATGIPLPQANLEGVEEVSPKEINDFEVLKDKPEGASLEGYLFPDTYNIYFDSPEEVVQRMVSNLDERFSNDLLQAVQEKEKNIHEIIIMASLIEKEVRIFEDKRKVSDILWRRLEVGMPLQVDATVNYVTGRRGVDVTIKETEVDSPYNTYEYKGLPEGPISNPGMESIEAALDPKENDYWYYLSEQEAGETIFSRTHEEHVRAKEKYLR